MQRPDEQKRRDIIGVATRLFATLPFHEVRLEDVAAEAGVGKATLYVYFASKEDLFLTLIREGFERLVSELRVELDGDATLETWERLALIVDGVVIFTTRFPHLYQLLRAGAVRADDEVVLGHRRALVGIIERTIRRGVRRGELVDPHPALTAQFVLSFVRGVLLHGPRVDRATLRDHLLRVLAGGIAARPVRFPRGLRPARTARRARRGGAA